MTNYPIARTQRCYCHVYTSGSLKSAARTGTFSNSLKKNRARYLALTSFKSIKFTLRYRGQDWVAFLTFMIVLFSNALSGCRSPGAFEKWKFELLGTGTANLCNQLCSSFKFFLRQTHKVFLLFFLRTFSANNLGCDNRQSFVCLLPPYHF